MTRNGEDTDKVIPWVFGYGSLMWNPGFSFLEKREARLYGYHRSFCVYSHVYRGTPEVPGLVLGLDRGGSCKGIAFRIDPQQIDEVQDYLRAREQVTAVYLEIFPDLFIDGVRTPGYCFIADRDHHQYAGSLPLDQQVNLIRRGQGKAGPNVDYLTSTIAHLDELNISDGPLHAIEKLL